MYAVPPHPRHQGKTEQYIGTWFKNSGKRDKWILASKISGGVGHIREGQDIDATTMRQAVEASLARLQTDYIDIYQLHWPNRGTYHFENYWKFKPWKQPREKTTANILEILQTADALIREGKIRHIAVSNESVWGIMQFLKLAEQHNLPRLVSVQNEYSLLRRHYDLDMAEMAHHEDISLLTYSSMGGGALSGKYLDGAVPKGSRSDISGGLWRSNEFSQAAIRAYVNLAKDHDLDPGQMALAFALSRPFTTSVIIGATKMDQLKSDIAIKDITLSEDVLNDIEAIYRCHPRPL